MNIQQVSEIQSALNSIWETIAPDVLQMCENQTADKNLVVEMCLDADRVATMGELEPETLAAWQELDYSGKLILANRAFSHSSYGY